MKKDFHAMMKEMLFDEWNAIQEQPIPSCLCQFGLDWKDKTYRESRYFPFAAKCKGMPPEEYGDFLDKKMRDFRGDLMEKETQ